MYIMQALVIPDHVLTDINRLLFRFLRRKEKERKKERKKKKKKKKKGKRETVTEKPSEKVKRIVVCNDFGNGGLKMIDLQQMQASFLLHWVVKLCQAQTCRK